MPPKPNKQAAAHNAGARSPTRGAGTEAKADGSDVPDAQSGSPIDRSSPARAPPPSAPSAAANAAGSAADDLAAGVHVVRSAGIGPGVAPRSRRNSLLAAPHANTPPPDLGILISQVGQMALAMNQLMVNVADLNTTVRELVQSFQRPEARRSAVPAATEETLEVDSTTTVSEASKAPKGHDAVGDVTNSEHTLYPEGDPLGFNAESTYEEEPAPKGDVGRAQAANGWTPPPVTVKLGQIEITALYSLLRDLRVYHNTHTEANKPSDSSKPRDGAGSGTAHRGGRGGHRNNNGGRGGGGGGRQ